MATMQVILTDEVPNLGSEGDTVKVKSGYARNYLIPNGLAFFSTSASAAQINHKMRQIQDLRKSRIKTEQDLANRLSQIEVRIPVRVGEEDRVFGSVTSRDITEGLAKKGFELDRRKIHLEEPIRALGIYTVPVRLSADISSHIRVWVVKEEK